MIDHYEVLKVAPTVSQEALREQYRFLLQAFHPDKFSGAGQEKLRARAEEETKRLNASYDVLRNPVTRREYDRQRQARATERRERSAEARPTPPPPRATPPPPPPRSPQLTAPTKAVLVAVALILVALRLAMHHGGTSEGRAQRSETSAPGNNDNPVTKSTMTIRSPNSSR